MIDKEIIAKNEAENDGKTIYLYYDDIAGMYMAFGLSAYYIGQAGYQRWASGIQTRHGMVAKYT